MLDRTLFDDAAATFHPCATIFPLMDGEAFANLVADIKANGLRHPIVEMGNAILDGRNRYRACNEAGVAIKTVKYTGHDPLGYVISANLQRRHLNETARGMVAVELANMPPHRPPQGKRANSPTLSQPEAASLLHVSTRTVKSCKVVRDRCVPGLVARVSRGEIAASLAAQIAAMPKAQQEELVDADEPTLRAAGKKAHRARRETDLAAATAAAAETLGSKLYGVIYADPPWQFAPYSRETGLDRAADNHYPTMTTEAICDLQVPAADDSALFLWATAPMLLDALKVMEAWGFAYKTHYVWAKDKIGTGYWSRNRHELLLLGTRGSIPAPAPGEQADSIIAQAPATEHSTKPAIFAEMIEEMFPSAALLEMFARRPRAGWDVWGNQSA